jgi:hypothetical protein
MPKEPAIMMGRRPYTSDRCPAAPKNTNTPKNMEVLDTANALGTGGSMSAAMSARERRVSQGQ